MYFYEAVNIILENGELEDIIQSGFNINMIDKTNGTPRHWSGPSSDTSEVVETQKTILHVAITNNKPLAVKFLLDHGADLAINYTRITSETKTFTTSGSNFMGGPGERDEPRTYVAAVKSKNCFQLAAGNERICEILQAYQEGKILSKKRAREEDVAVREEEEQTEIKESPVKKQRLDISLSQQTSMVSQVEAAAATPVHVTTQPKKKPLFEFKPKVDAQKIDYQNVFIKPFSATIETLTETKIEKQKLSKEEKQKLKEENKKIGFWGEQAVYNKLLHDYNKKGKIKLIDSGFSVSKMDKDDQIKKETKVIWYNQKAESYKPIDFEIIKQKLTPLMQPRGKEKRYAIEVKSTVLNRPAVRKFSDNEVQKMFEYGKRYRIFFVSAAGSMEPKFQTLSDPVDKLLTGQLPDASLKITI